MWEAPSEVNRTPVGGAPSGVWAETPAQGAATLEERPAPLSRQAQSAPLREAAAAPAASSQLGVLPYYALHQIQLTKGLTAAVNMATGNLVLAHQNLAMNAPGVAPQFSEVYNSLHLLWQLSNGPKTVTELTDASGAARTVVSQHLAKLRLSGLVDTRKDGRHVIYSLHDGHLVRLIRETINHADHRTTGEPTHD